MAFNKKFFQTGGIVASSPSAPAAFDPYANFETVTYTGNGGTQKITGYIRKGAAFNGSSSGISINEYASTISGNDPFSISMWANVSSTGTNCLFEFGRYATTGVYRAFVNSSSQINFQFRNSSSITNITTTDTLSNNTWYNLIFTFNGSNAIIYIDGSQSQTGTASYNFDLAEGRIGFSFDGYNFNGKIDQVRIFNKALSSSEVTTLYGETYASSTKSTTDIFGDGSGVALYELDDSANDTGTNSGTIDSGQSAVFNDTSSYINISSLPELSTTRTVALWVNSSTVLNNDRLFGSVQSSNYFNISFGPNNNISAYTGGTPLISANNSILQNVWYHIALVANGTTGKLYINGQEVVSTSITSHTINPTAAYIGTNEGAVGVQIPAAYIDDVRVYSSALSATDIGYLASNDTLNIPTSNLVAYYDLDGDANDSSGNAYNGTATNITYTDPAEIETSYNGTATNVNYLGMAFQPDLVWAKCRDLGYSNVLIDSVRGAGSALYSNLTSNEDTSNIYMSSLDSNGFTLTSLVGLNSDTRSFVAWCWKAGGAAVSNTNGSITSQVSANTDAGFSIVKYTGNSGSIQTVGHGLSSAPEMIIIKNISDGAQLWSVYHSSTGNGQVGHLNLTNAFSASGDWGSTTPTSTVFTIGSTDGRTNSSGGENHIAYCFHSVDGYQKVGSYSGSNSNLQVTTGFQPRFVLLKNKDAATPWAMFDNLRSGNLYANDSAAESDTASNYISFNSTGFELVGGTGSYINIAGYTWIYLAIA